MRKILQDFPLYSWGWDRLLDWLEEDGSMKDARELLQDAPAPLLQDPEFASRRLLLLGKEEPGNAEHDEEWEQLLADFPQNEAVHLQRFDQLWEGGRGDECLSVISAADKYHPTSPYVIARRAQALARGGDTDDLVTGTAGSAKTTTLAGMIDFINRERAAHVVTIEDPIEFVHEPQRCLIHQRGVGTYCEGLPEGVRSALREAADPESLPQEWFARGYQRLDIEWGEPSRQ